MKLTRADVILIIILSAVSVFMAIPGLALSGSKTPNKVVVTSNQKILLEKNLSDSGQFTIQNGPGKMVLEIDDNRVRVLETNCHRKICQSQGWINLSGQAIYCLPNNIIVRLNPENQDNIDAVLR